MTQNKAVKDGRRISADNAPELVEILKALQRHRYALGRKINESSQEVSEADDSAYWDHPLLWLCEQLEERGVGLTRHELELAAERLNMGMGLRRWKCRTRIPGVQESEWWPDWLWLGEKFRELDREGVTARLWTKLVDDFPAVLAEAGLINTPSTSTDAKKSNRSMEKGESALNAEDCTHSIDFRSVNWFGTQYTLTTMQAACVKVLWEHWQQRTPVIGEVQLLETAGSAGSRLRDVFDNGKHPAWGSMIVPASKGAYRLAKPD